MKVKKAVSGGGPAPTVSDVTHGVMSSVLPNARRCLQAAGAPRA